MVERVDDHGTPELQEREVATPTVVLLTCSAQGLVTFISPTWTEVTGHAHQDSLGSHFLEFIHPADRRPWMQLLERLAEKSLPSCRKNVRVLTRAGASRWFEAHVSAEITLGGELGLVHGTLIDVTDRKQSEAARRLREQRFFDFADAASDWLWEMDADLRFSYISDHVVSIMGAKSFDVLGKSRLDITDENVTNPKWQSHVADLKAHRPFRDFEYAHRHPDGETRFLRISGKPVFSVTGEFLGYRGIGTNITDQRLAEAALQETQVRAKRAEQRLADAVERMSEGFVLFDADRTFVLCNSRYREFYPCLTDLLTAGTPLEALIHRFHAAEAYAPAEGMEALLAARLDPGLTHYTTEQRTASGRWIRISDHRTSDGGVVGIRTDITLLKEQEHALRIAKDAAEQASRAKSAFLASMSHELRTPLNAIIGFSTILKVELADHASEPVFAEYLDDIHQGGEHLLGLINDVLDVARYEAGRLDLNEDAIDLGQMVTETIRMVQSAFPLGGHHWEVDLPSPAPVLLGDRRRLRQVLLNLLGNALKFTPNGGHVGVHVRTDDAISITITDTGIGIHPDRLADVGQAFVQIDDAKSRRYPGSGLGLHISRALIERHGGTLDIGSQPGVGTTVTVRLPYERLRAADTRAASRQYG